MSGETRSDVSGWTIDTLVVHHEAIRSMQEKLDNERDRRYAEVATEREKALKIKETADLAALGLAREIQTYKDEKANQLREQINNERGQYASKGDLRASIEKVEETLKPVVAFIAAAQGARTGVADSRQLITWLLGLALAVLSIYTFTQKSGAVAPAAPQIIYVPAPATGVPLPSTPQSGAVR